MVFSLVVSCDLSTISLSLLLLTAIVAGAAWERHANGAYVKTVSESEDI